MWRALSCFSSSTKSVDNAPKKTSSVTLLLPRSDVSRPQSGTLSTGIFKHNSTLIMTQADALLPTTKLRTAEAVLLSTPSILTAVYADLSAPGVIFQNQLSLEHHGEWPPDEPFLLHLFQGQEAMLQVRL